MFDLFGVPQGENRRSSTRGPLYMLVEAHTLAQPLWAFDLSLSGVRCLSQRPIWPGTYLDLSFVLPDSRERIVTGSQVMVLDTSDAQELMLGLRFCCLADGARMAIYRFLDRRRRLWDKVEEEGSPVAPHGPVASAFDCQAPFANLLTETYADLGLTPPLDDEILS